MQRALLNPLTLVLVVVLPASVLAAAAIPRPSVPAAINAPAAEHVVLLANAIGTQIYVCSAAADGAAKWTLKAPDAILHSNTGSIIGRHYAGPTWKLEDGSEITGKVIAHVDSPDPEAIPWLLLSVTEHKGNGLLTKVTSVQRIHTRGGQAPSAVQCDASILGRETKSHYTADYYFYAPARR